MAPAHPHLEILANLDNIVNISTNTPVQCNYPGHFLFSSSGATEGIEENLNRRQQRKRIGVSAYRRVGVSACRRVGVAARVAWRYTPARPALHAHRR